MRRGADFKKRPGGGKEAQVVLGQGICCLLVVDGGEVWSPVERDAVLLSARKVVVVVGPGLRPFPGRGGYLEGCGPLNGQCGQISADEASRKLTSGAVRK